ncbi:hypothetical protein B0H63DRAFT_453009 [Podospora didyma]|uniref:Uncharacterized protein n=1 Tax=Podospora didyma TaxID=330526 RepID=A0AAE0N8Z9_9PEZI|nr:hypothetical protein B0H63DRAFT_453009 [Podospora didyma]
MVHLYKRIPHDSFRYGLKYDDSGSTNYEINGGPMPSPYFSAQAMDLLVRLLVHPIWNNNLAALRYLPQTAIELRVPGHVLPIAPLQPNEARDRMIQDLPAETRELKLFFLQAQDMKTVIAALEGAKLYGSPKYRTCDDYYAAYRAARSGGKNAEWPPRELYTLKKWKKASILAVKRDWIVARRYWVAGKRPSLNYEPRDVEQDDLLPLHCQAGVLAYTRDQIESLKGTHWPLAKQNPPMEFFDEPDRHSPFSHILEDSGNPQFAPGVIEELCHLTMHAFGSLDVLRELADEERAILHRLRESMPRAEGASPGLVTRVEKLEHYNAELIQFLQKAKASESVPSESTEIQRLKRLLEDKGKELQESRAALSQKLTSPGSLAAVRMDEEFKFFLTSWLGVHASPLARGLIHDMATARAPQEVSEVRDDFWVAEKPWLPIAEVAEPYWESPCELAIRLYLALAGSQDSLTTAALALAILAKLIPLMQKSTYHQVGACYKNIWGVALSLNIEDKHM